MWQRSDITLWAYKSVWTNALSDKIKRWHFKCAKATFYRHSELLVHGLQVSSQFRHNGFFLQGSGNQSFKHIPWIKNCRKTRDCFLTMNAFWLNNAVVKIIFIPDKCKIDFSLGLDTVFCKGAFILCCFGPKNWNNDFNATLWRTLARLR